MNKAILTSFVILCLLSILFLMECKISVKADLTTWTVDDDRMECPDADFTLIQEAINSPDVKDGDTIFVYNGIYNESVFVNKSVSLLGEDRDSTIVDGNRIGNVISITADNVSIEGFTIKRSGTSPYDCGISVEHSSGIDVSHNAIKNNYYGISLSSSSNNVFSGNIISSNNDGISLYLSSNNVFSGNTISSNNYYGIVLGSSSNNVFSGNTISSNNYYGMYLLLYSTNNIIYCNNFINNTQQVHIQTSGYANVWDDGYPSGGNYWSDYTGQDLNADGIGDTVYVIDVNNRDNHPLMGMFSGFNVTLERETYHVTTICNSTISEFRFEIGLETGNKIISFNVTGKDGAVGFCRVMIPTELMNYPYIVLVGVEEIVPTLLDVSNETYIYLYFTYVHSSYAITIISSKTLTLYNELLDKYVKLQIYLYNLNATYYDHLDNYILLLGNYSQLQKSYRELNNSYQEHLNNYILLLGNYSQLQKSYRELNNSYQEHILDYSKNVQNIRNLMYIFAATTAIFIITTIYLSKHAHVGKRTRFNSP